jgi:hypothetical protein
VKERRADLTGMSDDKLLFVGNVKSPIWAGRVKEARELLDEEFWELFDIWRFYRSGLIKISIEEDSMRLCTGMRAMQEEDR